MQAFYFKKAQPVWVNDRTFEKNLHLSFKPILQIKEANIIKLAASSVYRLFINGQLIAIGPARTAAGFYKVDTFDLTPYLGSGDNVLVIEVVGYNVNSYYTLNQASFLTAEVEQMGKVTAYTGADDFKCHVFKERVQKAQRYSFQRPFAESYRLTDATQRYRISPSFDGQSEDLEIVDVKDYCKRDVRYPEYETLLISKVEATGLADFSHVCEYIKEDRSYTNIGDTLLGYEKGVLDEHLSTAFQNISFIKALRTREVAERYVFEENQFMTFSFPYNATGLIAFEVICSEPTVIYGLFDEILINEDVDTTRLDCCNGIKIEVDAGTHPIITFEPYTLKYLKIVVQGACTIGKVRLIEYKHPSVPNKVMLPQDHAKLQKIYEAALETYLSNAVDAFTDCPSRERAGWLCDSYFTARVEKCLTGESQLEKSFLENFVLTKEFPFLPKGMLPMCYPADHSDGNFIPNWAMWFVLQLEEYFKRTGDGAFIEAAKDRVYGLLDYFKPFENELGLLEKLEAWVFVEWSKAADFTQDVSYPTNMIYAKMLEAVGKLYVDEQCQIKSELIKSTIRARSFNGKFFTDNEVRKEGELVNLNNTTEVCQYYAFFTGVATPDTYAELWQTLVNDFGPHRKNNNLYKEVHFANAFIGNYLRLELLYQNSNFQQLLEEIEGYFYGMAERTGTLWEHDAPSASCNHGFASHIIYWLAGIYGMESASYIY